jgi:hypothetical protein
MLLARAACLVHPHATIDTTLLSQRRERELACCLGVWSATRKPQDCCRSHSIALGTGSEAQASWSSWTLQGWCMYSECCDLCSCKQNSIDREGYPRHYDAINGVCACIIRSFELRFYAFFVGWKRMRERKCEGNVSKRRQKLERFSLWCFSFLLLFLKMMCFFFCVLLEKFIARDLVVRIKFASFI